MSDQMIFKRYEMKYLLDRSQLQQIQKAMQDHMTADEHGPSTICSLYFDTPDHLLIRRSLDHPIYKEKIRLRSYGVADKDTTVFLELKKKYDSIVYKRRVGMKEEEAEQYLFSGIHVKDSQIIHELDYCLSHYDHLAPAVLMSYEREAFYADNDHDFRMTFDHSILWRDDHLSLCEGIFGAPVLDEDHVLMEVKTAQSMPMWLVKVLSENHIYKTSFSKYGTAYRTILQHKKEKGENIYA